MDEQLRLEGIMNVPYEQRLNEAVFAGNALSTIHDCAPYEAIFGRTSTLLPALEVLHDDGEIVRVGFKA